MIHSNTQGKLSVFRHLMWIFLFAFAARVAVRLYAGERDFWENGYRFFFALAQNIAAGNGVSLGDDSPTAFRVPLYPMFLAAVTLGHHAFLPVIIAQSLIGAGTVLCAALIARELFGNAAAIIAAVLVAIYPYYVVHDTALQETSLYTFLMALAVAPAAARAQERIRYNCHRCRSGTRSCGIDPSQSGAGCVACPAMARAGRRITRCAVAPEAAGRHCLCGRRGTDGGTVAGPVVPAHGIDYPQHP